MSFWPFLVLQSVIFLGLVWVLRQMLGRNLTDATAHLQRLNAEYARRQEELKQRLEEAEQQYRTQMTQAKVEAEELVTRARQETESSRARLLEEARGESERIVQQGMESRDALRREIEQQMEARVIERACELIAEALPQQLRQDIQAQWIAELLRQGFGRLSLNGSHESIREVRVACAFPLTSEQRQALSQRLKDALGRDVPLTEAVDDGLVAGLMITIGSLVLDGSLKSKVQHAARHAQPHP